ncbi:hypothetical protein RchiOBHm_Chr4g0435351 [Rosa chinensis]|uniref:Uncharacterized protein n=1 Tax=Rosa chinensis TaxID=74649 RepID=A0A2P6R1T0_ROSCH|nr:hypothetical protein RchiOBHm_Chr4g0435351 [Rosa chinensis]
MNDLKGGDLNGLVHRDVHGKVTRESSGRIGSQKKRQGKVAKTGFVLRKVSVSPKKSPGCTSNRPFVMGPDLTHHEP